MAQLGDDGITIIDEAGDHNAQCGHELKDNVEGAAELGGSHLGDVNGHSLYHTVPLSVSPLHCFVKLDSASNSKDLAALMVRF